MAEDPMRAKARATFGKTFMDAAKPRPLAKDAATASQKVANQRPIPTYKVGGVVKKADGGVMPGRIAARIKAGNYKDGGETFDYNKGGKVQTSADTARKLATEMGGMKDGGSCGMKPVKKAVGGRMGKTVDAARDRLVKPTARNSLMKPNRADRMAAEEAAAEYQKKATASPDLRSAMQKVQMVAPKQNPAAAQRAIDVRKISDEARQKYNQTMIDQLMKFKGQSPNIDRDIDAVLKNMAARSNASTPAAPAPAADAAPVQLAVGGTGKTRKGCAPIKRKHGGVAKKGKEESVTSMPKTSSGRSATMGDLNRSNRDTGGMTADEIRRIGEAIERGNRTPYEPIPRAKGGAAKVRKGMMTEKGDIKQAVKPKKGIGGMM